MDLTKRGNMDSFVIVTFTLFFHIIESAKKKATRFRKKLFWMEGRSPERRTNRFMQEKQKAEQIIKRIALFFDFTFFVFISLYLSIHWIK